MKRFSVYIALISVIFLGFMAGSKTGGGTTDDNHHVDENDDIFPEITVSKPVSNQVFTIGDSIIVEGFATDNKSLYKGKVKITDDSNGSIVNEQLYETHFLKRIDFNVTYKATVASVTDYTVTIEFEDHGLNMVNRVLKVKVNP